MNNWPRKQYEIKCPMNFKPKIQKIYKKIDYFRIHVTIEHESIQQCTFVKRLTITKYEMSVKMGSERS